MSDRPIIDYRLVTDSSPHVFERKIDFLREKGFEFYGNLQFITYLDVSIERIEYVREMVKYEEE